MEGPLLERMQVTFTGELDIEVEEGLHDEACTFLFLMLFNKKNGVNRI
jgi:hypothetical protein